MYMTHGMQAGNTERSFCPILINTLAVPASYCTQLEFQLVRKTSSSVTGGCILAVLYCILLFPYLMMPRLFYTRSNAAPTEHTPPDTSQETFFVYRARVPAGSKQSQWTLYKCFVNPNGPLQARREPTQNAQTIFIRQCAMPRDIYRPRRTATIAQREKTIRLRISSRQGIAKQVLLTNASNY